MAVYNRQTMVERLGDDETIHKLVLEVFMEDLVEQLEGLKRALADQDTEQVGRMAHTIKGAAGNASADNIRELAMAIEKSARGGILSGLEESLDALLSEHLALTAELAAQGLVGVS